MLRLLPVTLFAQVTVTDGGYMLYARTCIDKCRFSHFAKNQTGLRLTPDQTRKKKDIDPTLVDLLNLN